MAMESLGGKFAECARNLLTEAAGEAPPAGFPTAMLENMVKEIVEPSGRVSEEFTCQAIRAMASLSKGGAKELDDATIMRTIRKSFDI